MKIGLSGFCVSPLANKETNKQRRQHNLLGAGNNVTAVLFTDDLCNLPPESGMCPGYFPSYYYNSTTMSCESFVYSGCGGNGNRFATVAECEARCLRRRLGESSTEYPLISPAIIHNAMVATTIRLRFDGHSTAV